MRREHKKTGPDFGPRSTTPQFIRGDEAYFFFEDFLLLLDFFDEDLAADFFDAAILFTTFHAVRDLPVAPSWQNALDRSSKLKP